jgi:hypothetical protein
MGGPSFEFTRGPDGRLYAVGGEVKLDTSEIPDNPEATIEKARTIQRAALAPAQPSGQDRQVAAQAKAMEMKAQQEVTKETRTEERESDESESSDAAQTGTPSSGVEKMIREAYRTGIEEASQLVDTAA